MNSTQIAKWLPCWASFLLIIIIVEHTNQMILYHRLFCELIHVDLCVHENRMAITGKCDSFFPLTYPFHRTPQSFIPFVVLCFILQDLYGYWNSVTWLFCSVGCTFVFIFSPFVWLNSSISHMIETHRCDELFLFFSCFVIGILLHGFSSSFDFSRLILQHCNFFPTKCHLHIWRIFPRQPNMDNQTHSQFLCELILIDGTWFQQLISGKNRVN